MPTTDTFDTPGADTWTCPTGVTSVVVICGLVTKNGYYTPEENEALKGVVLAVSGYYGLGE